MTQRVLNKLFILTITIATLSLTACGRGRGHKTGSNETTDSIENNHVSTNETKNYHPLNFKLYVERSGSMVGFDSNGSKGEFKRTVGDMLNNIPNLGNDSTSLYIVNDDVYPLYLPIREFISDRDIFGHTSQLGNPNYTDFSKIFEMIMSDLEEYQVSILFSDLIYSVKGQENVNAQKLLNEANTLTNNVFRGYKNIDVTVVKFIGDFHGSYFPYNSPNRSTQYLGSRPFYAMIFARHNTQNILQSDPSYTHFRNYGKLRGYEDFYCFTSEKFRPYIEIQSINFNKKGDFEIDKNKGIKNAKERQNEFAIPVAINLGEIPVSEAYKTDSKNYEIDSKGGYVITSITPTQEIEGATHVILLEGQPLKDTVIIKMKNVLPRWIAQSSCDDDTDMNSANFGSTTFAFNEMMTGIYNAFIPSPSDAYFFNVSFEISR